MNFTVACTLAFLVAVEASRSLRGHRVIRIPVERASQWLRLSALLERHLPQADIWSVPEGNPWADVHLNLQEFEIIEHLLTENGFSFKVTIDDLQSLLDQSQNDTWQPQLNFRHKRDTVLPGIIGTYAIYEEIVAYLHEVASSVPEIANLTEIGRTYEDRPLLLLKLGIPRESPKPALWLDGGLHANEWIAPATALHIINKLSQGYTEGDQKVMADLTFLDWYIMPVCNPDGYSFTHTGVADGDRFWRKNRSPNPPSEMGAECNGTDLNRNFDFRWSEVGNGPYHLTCDRMYIGSGPSSELEVQAMSRSILAHKDRIMAYVSLHSYGQLWFTRWAYSDDPEANSNVEDALDLAQRCVAAVMAEGGAVYKAGRPYQYIYAYSGGSADWAHGVAGIRYCFGVELRDLGESQFRLPESYIDVSGREIYAGLQVVVDHLCNLTCHLTNVTSDYNFNSSPGMNQYIIMIMDALMLVAVIAIM